VVQATPKGLTATGRPRRCFHRRNVLAVGARRSLAKNCRSPNHLAAALKPTSGRSYSGAIVIQPGLGRWHYVSVSAGPIGHERRLGAAAIVRELRRDRLFEAATAGGRQPLEAAAHRLRTALQAVCGAVALLGREPAAAKRAPADQLLGVAHRNATEVARTIKDLSGPGSSAPQGLRHERRPLRRLPAAGLTHSKPSTPHRDRPNDRASWQWAPRAPHSAEEAIECLVGEVLRVVDREEHGLAPDGLDLPGDPLEGGVVGPATGEGVNAVLKGDRARTSQSPPDAHAMPRGGRRHRADQQQPARVGRRHLSPRGNPPYPDGAVGHRPAP
jgi:hypothetical protein